MKTNYTAKYLLYWLFLVIPFILTACKKGDPAPIDETIYNGNISILSQGDINAFLNKPYTIINGDIVIEGGINGNGIADLSGLSKIKEINGELSIMHCQNLFSLKGIENVNHINKLRLSQNENLRHAEALTNIRFSEKIYIDYNDVLENIPVLKNTNSLSGEIILEYNYQLKDLTFLSNITEAGGLRLTKLIIKDLNGLNKLRIVNGVSSFALMDNLVSLNGLDGLNSTESLAISYAPLLQNIEGLKNLKYIKKTVSISIIDSLKNVFPLMTLKHCNYFEMSIVSSITSLSGLDSLTVDSAINISKNYALTDFCPLKRVLKRNNGHCVFSSSQNANNPTKADILNCP